MLGEGTLGVKSFCGEGSGFPRLTLGGSRFVSLSSVKTHCSMLSSVFCFKLPEIGEHRVLRDLLRSFAIERPRRPQVQLSQDLDIVL